MIRFASGGNGSLDMPVIPPKTLYYKIEEKYLTAILAEGLQKGSQSHVHLSGSQEAAWASTWDYGLRRYAILAVEAGAMRRQGYHFYLSSGDYITDCVPPEFLVLREIVESDNRIWMENFLEEEDELSLEE